MRSKEEMHGALRNYLDTKSGKRMLKLCKRATARHLFRESKLLQDFIISRKKVRDLLQKKYDITRYKASIISGLVIHDLLNSGVLKPFDDSRFVFRRDKEKSS